MLSGALIMDWSQMDMTDVQMMRYVGLESLIKCLDLKLQFLSA